MFTENDAHRLLGKKLKFRELPGGSHQKYALWESEMKLSLPTFPVVPRHSGDLSRTVQKGLASALGLNVSRLLVASRCGISASCIFLCIAAKVLGVAMDSYRQDPTTYVHVPQAASATALRLLALAESDLPGKWNHDEESALDSVFETYLKALSPLSGTFVGIATSLATWQRLARRPPEGG